MSYNYTLKYKSFDQLMAEVLVDFQNYDLQNYIEPGALIKVAKRVNYDLGLRIFQTKEAVIEIENSRGKLPDDFYVLNFAFICGDYEETMAMPQGTWIEERPYVAPYKEQPAQLTNCEIGPVNCQNCGNIDCSCNPVASVAPYNELQPYGSYCIKPRVFLNCKNEPYELVQIVKPGLTRRYTGLWPIKILENPQTIDCNCPNLYMDTNNQAWIKDGWLYTTFKCAKVYVNYQGMMEDDDGNLLVPDHDMLNEYYEYALKQRILENLIMNDEVQAGQKLQLIEQRYRAARNQALSIVNTPNWAEFKRVWEANRKAQYAKYYNMFKSYPWYQNYYNNVYNQMNRF
jgi:hypothetical protein